MLFAAVQYIMFFNEHVFCCLLMSETKYLWLTKSTNFSFTIYGGTSWTSWTRSRTDLHNNGHYTMDWKGPLSLLCYIIACNNWNISHADKRSVCSIHQSSSLYTCLPYSVQHYLEILGKFCSLHQMKNNDFHWSTPLSSIGWNFYVNKETVERSVCKLLQGHYVW